MQFDICYQMKRNADNMQDVNANINYLWIGSLMYDTGKQEGFLWFFNVGNFMIENWKFLSQIVNFLTISICNFFLFMYLYLYLYLYTINMHHVIYSITLFQWNIILFYFIFEYFCCNIFMFLKWIEERRYKVCDFFIFYLCHRRSILITVIYI